PARAPSPPRKSSAASASPRARHIPAARKPQPNRLHKVFAATPANTETTPPAASRAIHSSLSEHCFRARREARFETPVPQWLASNPCMDALLDVPSRQAISSEQRTRLFPFHHPVKIAPQSFPRRANISSADLFSEFSPCPSSAGSRQIPPNAGTCNEPAAVGNAR